MRVLHVIPSVGLRRGGTSVWLRGVAPRIAAAGLEVHVATTDDDGPQDRMRVPLGAPVVDQGVTYWYFPRQSRFYTFSLPLGAWLARHTAEYDVIHIHALFSYAALPAAYWARRRGVPYIVQPHGMLGRWGMRTRRPLLKKCSLRVIERRILEHSAAVDFTNQSEMNEAAELGIDCRGVVIPLGTDAAGCAARLRGRFRERHGLAGRPIVLFLSRFDPKKNIPLLLAAFARVVRNCPGAVLVMAGSGDPAGDAELRAAAQGLGISGAVLWTGFLDGDDKLAALVDADVFALPSYSENFGIAVLEAMSVGVPVVVSEHVGIHAEIAEAEAGLVAPCDEEAFAGALARLLSDSVLRAWMGSNAEALARRRFSMEAVSASLIELYRTASERA